MIFWVWGRVAAPLGCPPHQLHRQHHHQRTTHTRPPQLRQAVLPPPLQAQVMAQAVLGNRCHHRPQPQALATAQAVLGNRCHHRPQPQALATAQAVLGNRCHRQRQAPNRPERGIPLAPWGNRQARPHLRQATHHELATVPAIRPDQKAARQLATCPNPTLVQLRAAHRREPCPSLILAQPLVQEVLGLHLARELRFPR